MLHLRVYMIQRGCLVWCPCLLISWMMQTYAKTLWVRAVCAADVQYDDCDATMIANGVCTTTDVWF